MGLPGLPTFPGPLGGSDAIDFISRHSSDDLWRNTPLAEIGALYRGMGLTFGNAALGELRNRNLAQGLRTQDIDELDDNQFVPARWTARPLGWTPSQKYQYRFLISYFDEETNEEFSIFRSFISDQELTKGEAFDSMTQVMLFGKSEIPAELQEIAMVAVFSGDRLRL